MQKLKIGILGCGGIANRHAQVLSKIGDVELKAFCDIDISRAESFNTKYAQSEGQVFSDFKEMYKKSEIDVVWICLPPFAHTNEVELAAKEGIHIFIEKPIALTLKKAEQMVEATTKHNVKSQVGFMMRFGDAINSIKGLLKTKGPVGLIIARYFCNSLHSPWWRDDKKSGGQVVEQAIHIYDIVRFFLDDKIKSVYGKMNNLFHKKVENYTSEDISSSILVSKDGAIACVSATNAAIPGRWTYDFRLVAKGMTALIEDPNTTTINFTDKSYDSEQKIVSQKDIFFEEATDLLDAVKNNKKTKVPMIEGYKSLELVLSVKESAKKGKEIKI